MLCKHCWDKIPPHIMSTKYCSLKCELEAVEEVREEVMEGIDDLGSVLKRKIGSTDKN